MNPLHLLDPIVPLAHTALRHLDAVLTPWLGGTAVAVSLILITALVRLLIMPLSFQVARADRARRALAPKLADLRRTHRDDAQRLLRETTAAYREAGTGPFAGVVPALVQAPALTVLYRLCTLPVVAGSPNLVLSATLFGAPLSQHGLAVVAVSGVLSLPALVFGITVALTTAVAAWSSAVAVARLDQAAGGPERAEARGVRSLTRVMPYATVVVALVVPLAVSLYLLTSTLWATAERVAMARLMA